MKLDESLHVPNEAERQLLGRLLSVEFAGVTELRVQIESARVRWIQSAGAPALLVLVGPTTPPAKVDSRVPVEGVAVDADQQPLHFLLHVVDGRLSEVEIYREDGGQLLQMPKADALSVECLDRFEP